MLRKMIFEKRGLTLIELMIVLALSTIVMGTAFVAYLAQSKSGRAQEQIAILQQDLLAGMDIIERDVRNAGCDPTLADIDPFLVGTTGVNALAVQWDTTASSGVASHYIYRLDSANLLRNEQPLILNVTEFTVSYWDSSGIEVVPGTTANSTYNSGLTLSSSQEETVCSVDVSMTLRSAKVDPDTDEYVNRTLSRRIRLRNVK